MDSLPKVLFLIPSISSGGIENYLLRFLRFNKTALNSTVLVRGSSWGNFAEEYQSLNIPIVFMPLGYFNPIRWWSFYKYLKKNEFKTVCDFNANFAGIPMWLAKRVGVKNRITFYRQGNDHFNSVLHKRIYNRLMNKLVYSYATSILANSKVGIDYFFQYRKIDDLRFKVINNGIDIEQYITKVDQEVIRRSLSIPLNTFIIGHTGRLDKTKNHATILKVANELIKKDSNYYLVLCGRDTEKLIDQVREMGISENVRLLGYRSDIPELLQIFDVFYFPSITEGQPNSLIEAMIFGLPFVASNINPIKEMVPVEFHNWLTSPTNIEDAVRLISSFKKGNYDNKEKIDWLKKSSIAKFDSQKRFSEFMKILVS